MPFIKCLNECSERIQESKKYSIPTSDFFSFSFRTKQSIHITDTVNLLKHVSLSSKVQSSQPAYLPRLLLTSFFTQTTLKVQMNFPCTQILCEGPQGYPGVRDSSVGQRYDNRAQGPILKASLRQFLIYAPCPPPPCCLCR